MNYQAYFNQAKLDNMSWQKAFHLLCQLTDANTVTAIDWLYEQCKEFE